MVEGGAGPLRAAHASATHALGGQPACGDLAWFCRRGDRLFAALLDGLGHGQEAARAAQVGAEGLQQLVQEGLSSPRLLMERLHALLRPTRGVALSILVVSPTTLSFGGVGNVDLVSTVPGYGPFPREGILGYRCRFVPDQEAPARPGLYALYTDGVNRFDPRAYADLPLEQLPGRVLQDHGRIHDDQGVAVVALGR